jgi:hypothetical protein
VAVYFVNTPARDHDHDRDHAAGGYYTLREYDWEPLQEAHCAHHSWCTDNGRSSPHLP